MNSVNKTKTTKKKIKRKIRIKGKRLPNNRKKRTNVIRGRKIAAASAKNFKKKFETLRQNGNSVRVTGRDLIYSIPDDLTSPIQSTNVITVIPANPAYWKGTRIAALASGYQNYRPILFKITYVPMCAVTQQGNVIGGTIWDDGIDNDNLQQSLRTSNGGFMTQCYVPHTTRIRPRSNLQFNLYRMGGEFSTTSNPFIFIALAIGCKNSSNQRVTPGYFYVTWSFELKNPIGSINSYNNTGLITYGQLQLDMNNTLINIDPNSDVPFGAYIDVEQGEEGAVASYNGTDVNINENTPVWAFTSVTKTSTARSVGKIPIIYNTLTTNDIRIGYGGYKAYLYIEDNGNGDNYIINIPVGTPQNQTNWRFKPPGIVAYELNDIHQNFGAYVAQYYQEVSVYDGDTFVRKTNTQMKKYVASRKIYNIQIYNPSKNKNLIENNIEEQKEVKEEAIKEDGKEEEEEENISQVFENKVRLEPLVRDSSKKSLTNRKHN
jgi:hypothetical protein